MHQFADDSNLFDTVKSVKNLNSLVNRDMKYLNNWLSANKISRNVEKTEQAIFKSLRYALSEKGYIHQTHKNILV